MAYYRVAVTVLWLVSIALKAIAAAVLVRRRLYAHFPMAVAFLLYSTLASLFLVAVRSNKLVYGWGWIFTGAIQVALLALVAIEAFRRIAESYENFTWPMTVITGLSTLVGVIGALIVDTSTPSRNYWSYVGILSTVETYVIGGGCAMLIAALFLLPRYRTVPIRPAAERNVACVLVYMGGMFIASILMQSLGSYPIAGYFSTGAAALASTLWIALLTPASNEMPPARNISDKRLRKAERRLRDYRNFTVLG